METNEARTFDRVRAGRIELFEPEVKHHEHIFKLMRDRLLAEYASVADAVEHAVTRLYILSSSTPLPVARRERARQFKLVAQAAFVAGLQFSAY